MPSPGLRRHRMRRLWLWRHADGVGTTQRMPWRRGCRMSTPEVAALFDYLESVNAHRGPDTDPCGFECHVHDDAALAWLKTMRPALYATLTAAKTVGAEA